MNYSNAHVPSTWVGKAKCGSRHIDIDEPDESPAMQAEE